MSKLLIIDGHNLLFQMFFGMPSRIIGKGGKPVHGILGFTAALLKIIRMTSPTDVIVIFDGEVHNPRKDLDADYKSNRPDYSTVADEDNPFTQLDGIFSALDFLGIKWLETVDTEADDLITSYARAYDGEVVISSYDSDFFQLIDESISVLRYRGDSTVVCDSCYVEGRYGIPPSMYAEHKALVGDTADNIVGVPGVGPKTAAALLHRFGSLDNLLGSLDEIEKEKLRRSLCESRERILLNRRLIMLSPSAPLPVGIDAVSLPELPGFGAAETLRRINIM